MKARNLCIVLFSTAALAADHSSLQIKIIDGKAYAPVRAISEALGVEVKYNNQTKQVTLARPSSPWIEQNSEGSFGGAQPYSSQFLAPALAVKKFMNLAQNETLDQNTPMVRYELISLKLTTPPQQLQQGLDGPIEFMAEVITYWSTQQKATTHIQLEKQGQDQQVKLGGNQDSRGNSQVWLLQLTAQNKNDQKAALQARDFSTEILEKSSTKSVLVSTLDPSISKISSTQINKNIVYPGLK